MLSLQQAQSYIPNKRALYDACVMNQYRVPLLKTTLCTNNYLLAVKDQKCYTPVLRNVILTACTHPPPVQALHEMLITVIEQNFGSMSDETFL